MRNLLFSLFAIGVAAVAAMTATTAMLNTPVHPATEVMTQNMQAEQPPAAPAEGKPATSPGGPAGTPAPAPETAKPAPGGAPGAAPNTDTKAAGEDDDVDKDPYEGIAPEELPPDLQYSADSSVSFPTNI
jgi:hypothetical protein